MGKGEIAHYEQFLFTHSVFKRLILQTCKNQGLFGKGLKSIHKFEYRSYGTANPDGQTQTNTYIKVTLSCAVSQLNNKQEHRM